MFSASRIFMSRGGRSTPPPSPTPTPAPLCLSFVCHAIDFDGGRGCTNVASYCEWMDSEGRDDYADCVNSFQNYILSGPGTEDWPNPNCFQTLQGCLSGCPGSVPFG